jgi:hypothetical protein
MRVLRWRGQSDHPFKKVMDDETRRALFPTSDPA